jgi:hypothetical protein
MTGRRLLGGELGHGNELLQSDFADLGNFQQRTTVGNAVEDLSPAPLAFWASWVAGSLPPCE